ncbi:Ig-like domain-containing protein, partial [Lachnospiraceae bacterium 45-W7]
TVLPSNASNKTLSYRSSDETVATVSAGGEIEAKKAGNTIITVASVNGKTAELQVTVKPAAEREIAVEKVLVSTKKMTVGVGEKVQLEAAVYPRNASNAELTYKASNNKVKVNKKGRITAQKTGTCKITICSSNNKKVVVTVHVKKKPGKISLNVQKKTLKVGKKFQIRHKLPRGTASYNITYSSNKKSVAIVSKTGKVTARKKGKAVITVKTYNGKKAVIKIHVK